MDKYKKLATELYDYAHSLFDDAVTQKHESINPYACEFSMKLNLQAHKYNPKLIEINVYEDHIFMFIDEFRFEYDDRIDEARSDIKKYLYALKEDKLEVRAFRLLGIRFNQTLQITD